MLVTYSDGLRVWVSEDQPDRDVDYWIGATVDEDGRLAEPFSAHYAAEMCHDAKTQTAGTIIEP